MQVKFYNKHIPYMHYAVNERIKIFALTFSITQYRIAKIVGVSHQTVNQLFNNRINPSVDFLVKLLDAYPMLNAHWLLTGRGEMLLPEKVPLERQVLLEGVDKPKNSPVIPAAVNNS